MLVSLRYYRGKTRDQNGLCEQKGVKAEVVESQIDYLISTIKLPLDWRDKVLNVLSNGDTVAAMEIKRKKLTDRLARLKKLHLDGDLADEEYNRERAKNKKDMDSLIPLQFVDIEEAGRLLENFDKVWGKANLSEKKTLLRMIFEAVNVKDGKIVSIKPRSTYRPLLAAAGKVTKSDPDGIRGHIFNT